MKFCSILPKGYEPVFQPSCVSIKKNCRIDFFTQIALGAAVGEAVLGRKAGKKAMLWGGFAGAIPDFDFLLTFLSDPLIGISWHRGVSHSLLFSMLMAPLLATLTVRVHPGIQVPKKEWTVLFFLALFTHPLLDLFTNWGTQLLWPIKNRFAIQSIFVVDPLFSVPLFAGVIAAAFFKKEKPLRKRLNQLGLTIGCFYLLLTVVNKSVITKVFETALQNQEINYSRLATRPSPLNNILWAGTAETEESFVMGYYSHLDTSKTISFFSFSKNHQLLPDAVQDFQVKRLIELTQGWFTLEETENGLLLNDLRYGQGVNGMEGKGRFIFSWSLLPPADVGGKWTITPIKNRPKDGFLILQQVWNRMLGR